MDGFKKFQWYLDQKLSLYKPVEAFFESVHWKWKNASRGA